MWWEHQHQAHTEVTKFSCLEPNSTLNIHKMLYILPPFLPRLSRTERFYSVCTTQHIQDGFRVLIYCRDYPSSWLRSWNLLHPKCLQSVAVLLFSLASSAVTSVNTECHLGRLISVCVFTAKSFQRMCAVCYLLSCLCCSLLPALIC